MRFLESRIPMLLALKKQQKYIQQKLKIVNFIFGFLIFHLWTSIDLIKFIMSRFHIQNTATSKNYFRRSREDQPNPEYIKNKSDSSNIAKEERLNAQILRIKSQQTLKKIHNVWNYTEEQLVEYLSKYKSISGIFEGADLVASNDVKLLKTERKIYLGQIHSKQKFGKGITIYRDGRFYEGSYCDNQKNGKGCEVFANGNVYIGEYHQSKKHGKGTFFWFSLCEAAGTKLQHPKVQQYQGMWWGGLPDGEGQHQKLNGDFYLGHFKNGLKHGQGVQYYANGDKYSGQYINGMPEGFGQYIWADTSNYRGDFKQGYRNGYGVWTEVGGQESYKGHYLLDRKHGYGVYTWQNGYIYKGQFFEDQRNGEGELYYHQQLIYKGFWLNGQRCEEQDYQSRFLQSKVMKTASSKHQINNKQPTSKDVASKNKKTQLKKEQQSFLINFKHIEKQAQMHRHCCACKQSKSKQKKQALYSPAKCLSTGKNQKKGKSQQKY